MAKFKVVEAHRPGKGPKFTAVEISELQIVDHGNAAVVTCNGTFKGPQFSGEEWTLADRRRLDSPISGA